MKGCLDLASLGSRFAGRVAQMGAGHGDPELLTLKAVRMLQAADVIFFDDGLSKDILELARREAERLTVSLSGAGAQRKTVLESMIGLAEAGKQIVRLRLEDPLHSDSAQCEITALRQAGINVQLVAGVAVPQGKGSKGLTADPGKLAPTCQTARMGAATSRLFDVVV